MLCDANLPKGFWAEAVATASYVINRSPTIGLQMTPEEAFTGKRPNLAHLRMFGAKVMCHVPKEKRQKWDAKSEHGIFMGYSSSFKAYRVYNSKTKKIIVSRDDIFLDECATNRAPEVGESSSEVDLGELYVQPVIQHQEDERLESIEDRNDIDDDDGDSEYDDANGDEAAAVQHHQPIEQLAALPPQLEDPHKIQGKFDTGGCGTVLMGSHARSKQAVVIKIANDEVEKLLLATERRIYARLPKARGWPRLIDAGTYRKRDVLVLVRLGPSLQELLDLCGGRFGLKTVSQLALQLLARPETFHELGYVHCDMKPDNVLLGRGTTRKTLHLIDFDLTEPYRHPRTGGNT
ncbi:casein kinase 1-like protein HD16 [Anopheles arabiensis]|uniref:casein kinase 1-like protein HD16 n=1 Tax=Anopheles arabiensis TaxID=7173 RepID=UPI001AACD149|nr:casein kinase 1-like protein HD16 [Anopheles arabiensis]